MDEKLDAVDIWLESIGLDERLKAQIVEWIVKFTGSDADSSPIMLGLIIGLLVNQYNHDNPGP